ncbi:MAG TPA: hypothetical protein VLC52_11315 [Anaerolineae bacterium]|nr:hypothetical protein [Anaerolineae bacterium]
MRFKWYGWLGLAWVVVAQVLMFLKIQPVWQWFTPIVWSGYLLFADALVLRLRGRSLIHDRPREFVMMAWLSVFLSLIFEIYNLRLSNWYYINVPENPWLRTLSYLWAFATIFPGLFLTSEWVAALLRIDLERPSLAPRRFGSWWTVSIVVGLAYVTVPPLLPFEISRYLFGFVWLGVIFFLDPINHRLGAPSLIAEWEQGRLGRTAGLLAGGAVCGLLWEFWNFWAGAKWIYAVPILSELKIFEMPVLGFLGFPPFCLECFVLYQFARRVLWGPVWAPLDPGTERVV